MASLEIVRMGAPVLRQTARPVADPADPAIRRLAEDMTLTMVAAPGVGLAAPQVAQGLRLFVMRVVENRAAAADPAEPPQSIALINPEIEPLGPEIEYGWEGCLSIPDLRGVVPRYARIGYRAWLADGTRVEREASGFQARIIQHEFDHLDGILYLDRMRDFQTLGYAEEIASALRADEERGGTQ